MLEYLSSQIMFQGFGFMLMSILLSLVFTDTSFPLKPLALQAKEPLKAGLCRFLKLAFKTC